MTLPRVVTKATNVELTKSQQELITRRLAPIARLLHNQGEVLIEVVLRKTHSRLTGDLYYVSVKTSTPTDSFMAVSAKPFLGKALTSVRETLRRAISRGASVSDYGIRKARRSELDAYTLTL